MSLAGLKKQINKANQYVNEKIGGVKGTELDDEFVEVEKKIDVVSKMIEEVIVRTQEHLQPNPATRARLVTMNTINKLQGKAKSSMYPQPEGQLGDCMVKYGQELGNASIYGESLELVGETFRKMADLKYTFEDQVKQDFLEPLHNIQTTDLREINHHRKKLESRRLDFDCKKRKHIRGTNVSDEEMKVAEDKFDETRALAEQAMLNFINSDAEHIQILIDFVASEREYHRQLVETLEKLQDELTVKKSAANDQPKRENLFKSEKKSLSHGSNGYPSASSSPNPSSKGPFRNSTSSESSSLIPKAKALYDFEEENPSELGFNEGAILTLLQQVDENWFEGELNGKVGFFPINYVEVIVPLPK